MNKKWREWAKEQLSHYKQEFEPTLILEDENFFIFDWRDKNGSGNLATRYIVDKKKGDLIIKGDAGDCIASWYNEVKPEDLVHYINSTDYFIGKMQCTTHKYTYEYEDIEEDLAEIKKEFLDNLADYNIHEDIEDEEERRAQIEEDFEEMQRILEEINLSERCNYPSELVELMEEYDTDWWEGQFSHVGCRIDHRVYLWTYGYQEGVERLRGEEFVRKDI